MTVFCEVMRLISSSITTYFPKYARICAHRFTFVCFVFRHRLTPFYSGGMLGSSRTVMEAQLLQ